MNKAYLNWSSGKDSAFALYQIQQQKDFIVEKLVTTLNTESERVSMHGVRKELLLKQVETLEIPLHIIPLHGNLSMVTYNEVMKTETLKLTAEGYAYSLFGDIFLEDLREYRENQLEETGLKAIFPLWKKNTKKLITDFIEVGFKAIVVCTNAKLLDQSFCGRIIDRNFIDDLPENVDPCGENGEFHTFVFDGPIFKKPVKFQKGEVVEKTYAPVQDDDDNCFSDKKENWDNRFYYCDLIPNNL